MAIIRGPKIVKSGLVLALDAADRNSYPTTGTTWADLSGNLYNSTLTNGPTFNSSNGGSIVFDGINDLGLINSANRLQFTNSQAYSISAWIFWTESSTALGTIFSYSKSTGSNDGYYLLLDNNVLKPGSFLFDYFDGVNYNSIQGNDNVIPKNTWVNLCGTCVTNTGVNTFVFYINGKITLPINRSTVIPPSSINYTGLNPVVGNRGATELQMFKGRVSSVLVYNKTLSATEVLQNYNSTKSRFGL
jgi:hypothetical protein